MPRLLGQQSVVSDQRSEERSVARSTARAFAAAISALVISTLVVGRSQDALGSPGTVAANSLTAGTIALSDDDEGRSLFDLSAMVPGRSSESCIEVSYDGTILPVDLSLEASGQGDLLPLLEVTVQAGSGGRFGSCEGFAVERTVFDGTFTELADRGRLPLARILNADESRSYRIRFRTPERNEVLGRAASVDLIWEVTPS